MNKLLTLTLLTLALTGTAAAQGPSTNINISTIKTEPVPLQTSEYADVWFAVENTGSVTAEDVTVEFLETFPFETDPDEKRKWTISELPTGQERQYHIQVRVDPNAVHGSNDLRFRYSTGSGTTLTRDVPVQVRTDDTALVIEDLRFPDSVAPGQEASMDLTLRNLADSHLKNIDISLGLDETPLATQDTTRKRVQTIAPGERSNVSFTLSSDSSTATGLYTVPVSLEYENEAGTSFDVTEETGVRIGGQPRLEVGINENTVRTPGQTGEMTVRIVNRGDGSAEYVDMELLEGDGYEIISQPAVYLGSMDPDDYQTATVEVNAGTDLSRLEIPVELSYRAVGDDMTMVERQVSTELYSSQQLQQYGIGGSGSSLPLIIVVLVLAAGGIVYWRRRR